MSTITITISDARQITAISRKTAAYNAGLPTLAPQLTAEQYLATYLPLVEWCDQYAPAVIPSGDWLQRWTAAERKAARGLGTQSAQVQAWLDDLDAHKDVNLTHQEVIDGVNAVCATLEQLGVIPAGQGSTRATVILAF